MSARNDAPVDMYNIPFFYRVSYIPGGAGFSIVPLDLSKKTCGDFFGGLPLDYLTNIQGR